MACSDGLQMSSKQYYHECGFNQTRVLREEALKDMHWIEKMILKTVPKYSFRRATAEGIAKSWERRQTSNSVNWKFYSDKRWLNRAFSSIVKKRRYLDRFGHHLKYGFSQKTRNLSQQELVSRKRTRKKDLKERVIAFGNGRFPSSMRGLRSGPCVALVNHFSRSMQVVRTDEYNSSQRCSECKGEAKWATMWDTRYISSDQYSRMVDPSDASTVIYNKRRYNVVDFHGKGARKKITSSTKIPIRSVLKCQNTECGVQMDRDSFGSRNIKYRLECSLSGTPLAACFKRPSRGLRSRDDILISD
jgi:hypothetical protein